MKTLEKRFWAKVVKGQCWVWNGANVKGYGQFWNGKRTVMAHRFGYELFKGNIPDGLTLDHLCRNPSCVRWDHLEAVTLKENILRSDSACAVHARKTHCPQGHPYSGDNLSKRKIGRACRICRNKYDREHKYPRTEKQKKANTAYTTLWRRRYRLETGKRYVGKS